MAKIQIIMQAEISDLDSYYPDSPKGVTIQNVFSFLNGQLCLKPKTRILDLLVENMNSDKSSTEKDSLVDFAAQDSKLGERLMESIVILIEK